MNKNMRKVVNGKEIKNFPWEECPQGFDGPIWRYSKNPIIVYSREIILSNRVFLVLLVIFV